MPACETVMVWVVAPVDQKLPKEVSEVSSMLCPGQMSMTEGPSIPPGAVTSTVTCALAVSPNEFVPMTVYVVVSEGVATTEAPVVELSPVDGDHVYVTAPKALRVTL